MWLVTLIVSMIVAAFVIWSLVFFWYLISEWMRSRNNGKRS